MKRPPALLIVLLAWIGTSACASSSTAQNVDTHTGDGNDMNDLVDSGWDWGDTGTDILPDSPGDVPVDTTLDSTPDTYFDSPVDTGHDDGGPDIPWDPPTDTPDATGGIVGDACYSATQCTGVPGAGRTCLTTLMGYITFPGGYCSATCTSAADCGTGAQCVNLMDLGQYCLKQCTSAAQCRTSASYTCTAVSGAPGMFCIPPMSTPETGD